MDGFQVTLIPTIRSYANEDHVSALKSMVFITELSLARPNGFVWCSLF